MYKDKPNNKRLQIVLQKLQLHTPNKELMEATGYDSGNISSFINNKKSVPGKFLKKIYKHYGLDPIELPEDDLVVNSNQYLNNFIPLSNGQYLMTMPRAEVAVQAGFLDNFQDIEYLTELPQHSIIVNQPIHNGRYVAFRVAEHSMDNGRIGSIPAGYIVTARELQRHHWRDKLHFKRFPEWVIFTSRASQPLLKNIIEHDVETAVITCRSYNDDKTMYPDFELSLNEVNALFYVVDVSRGSEQREY